MSLEAFSKSDQELKQFFEERIFLSRLVACGFDIWLAAVANSFVELQ